MVVLMALRIQEETCSSMHALGGKVTSKMPRCAAGTATRVQREGCHQPYTADDTGHDDEGGGHL